MNLVLPQQVRGMTECIIRYYCDHVRRHDISYDHVVAPLYMKLGEKTTRSLASWMNRCLLALAGIANRTTEVAITPKGSFLPKMVFQICLIAFPKLKGGFLLQWAHHGKE